VPQGSKLTQTRISGQAILDELIRNMEIGQLEMGFSILLPCVFSIYLHPDDYARIASVRDLLREDARRALNARMAEWNGDKPLFRRGAPRKQYRIAQQDWWIEFFADTEGAVPPGDVEIHSELNDTAEPGYRGAKTSLIGREPSVTNARVAQDRGTRRNPERVFAEIRYQDDSGAQTFFVTQNEISIGRGGEDVWVDLPLYSSDEISREHLRIRRDPASGAFTIADKSRNGTWVNGKRLTRDKDQPLPERAEIALAEAVKLAFEVRR
jgi:hypothetical protein